MKIKFIFLAILGVVSVIYLLSLFFKRELVRIILKCTLVPLILVIYIFGTDKILLPVIIALVLGWLGDIFLLKISDIRCFRLGLLSFLLGHICYIIAMFSFAMPFDFTVLYVSIIIAALAGYIMFNIIRPGKEMKYPVIVYMSVIMIMSVFALQVFIMQGSPFGILVFIGSLSFLVSDSMLAFDTFRKKTKFGYFIVMLTYIAAQLLIVSGFSMIGV